MARKTKADSPKTAWRRELQRVSKLTDRLGKGMDPKIKEAVAICNLIGLPTTGSCEGHPNWGYPAPWIDIAAPNRPKFRQRNELHIYRQIAKQFAVKVEDVQHGEPEEAWLAVMKLLEKQPETAAFQAWRKRNNQLEKKITQLLKEFYAERKTTQARKITIERWASGIRIHNGGDDYIATNKRKKKLSKAQLKMLKKRLTTYQTEMCDFGEFLKEKFFT